MRFAPSRLIAGVVVWVWIGCSSAQPVKVQGYAALSRQRTLEYELPVVWKGIERVFQEYRITQRDPEAVDALEEKKLSSRSMETDWIYAQSRDKYHEYRINGVPRKKYLQTRFRYRVIALKRLGGTDVKVDMDEEVERLKEDGSSAGFDTVEQTDSSRSNEILERIQTAIHASSS